MGPGTSHHYWLISAMKFSRQLARVALAILILAGLLGLMLFKHGGPASPSRPVRSGGSVTQSDSANLKAQPRLPALEPSNAAAGNELLLTPDVRWNQPILEESFARFHDWAQEYLEAASAPAKAQLEAEGVQLAQQRQQELAALIESNPERALALSVPMAVRRALPRPVTELLEQRVSGRGGLVVLGALAEPGKEKEVVAVFRTATLGQKEYKAYVYGWRLGEPTRSDIPLNGIAVGNLLAVNENPLRILEPEEATAAKAQVSEPVCSVSGLAANALNQEVVAEAGGKPLFFCRALHATTVNKRLIAQESGGAGGTEEPLSETVAASAWTEGTKNLLFIRVDFSDLAGVPFSDSTGTNLVNGLASFYTEMSYGKTTYAPLGGGSDLTPTFRMPQPGAYYGTNDYYTQLRTDARNAAAAAGYVLTNYDRDLTCFGPVTGWSWAGLGYVGASGVWLRNYFTTGVAGHELGHNEGLNHANFWDTAGASVIGPGSNVEYGDPFDTMGQNASAGSYHFNARNKAYLNWLTTNDWVNVTSNGTYRIYAHDDQSATGLRALKVVKNSNTNYWVELRQKFTSNKWLMYGAGLRWAQNGNQQSLLLDTTPGSVDGKNDSAIVIGRTFADPDSLIYITPLGLGNTSPQSLDVAVNVGSFPGNVAPTVTVAASATNVTAGTVVNFTATANDANGDSLAYYWDFGDDTFGTNAPNVSKSWSATGEYLVRCTVTDMKGGEGSVSTIVDVGLPTTYRISGQVATTNAPVEGVRVYVSSTRMTYTDSDGTYTLVGLPAGTYTVAASLYKYGFTNSGFSNPVIVGPSAANINFLATALGTNTPPTITTQPASQTVSVGANANFSVVASGTLPLGYQWRFNGASIAGASASSYTKVNVQTNDAGNYSVVVSNVAGTVTSSNAVLAINTPPTITGQPQSQTVIAGNNASFSVTATGTSPLYYQWRSNSTNIAGATNPSYTRSNVQPADAGPYLVVVTNSLGAATSAPALLTVNFALTAAATYGGTVSKNPDQASYAPNSVVTLTAQPVTVFPFAGWSGSASGTNNPLSVTMTNNLAITANFTSPVPDIIVDNPAATFTGTWTISATAADKYGVDYATAATHASSATATATFAPSITTTGRYDVSIWYPTISQGYSSAQFSVSDASGSLSAGVNQSSGSGGWLSLASGRDWGQGTNGYVRLSNLGGGNKNVVADAVRWVYSENQVAPPVITAQPQDQDVVAGQSASFSVLVTGSRPLSYQWSFNGTPVGTSSTSSLTISNAQPANAGAYSVVVTNAYGAVTSMVASLTINVPPSITLQPQSQTVAAGQPVSFSAAATGTDPLSFQWSLNGGPITGATNSTFSIASAQSADAGSYTVQVTNAWGVVTSAVAILTVNFPPSISAQPQDQSVIAGQTASFSVSASGTPPLSYQWYLNGAPVGTSSTSSLTIPNAQLANAGAYLVLITNVAGAITSAPANLTVSFTLTATATPGGTVSRNPDQAYYAANSQVALTATAGAYSFAGWSGDASGTNNPLTITMITNLSITANFTSPVPDIIIDNPAATLSGSWTTSTTASDKYGPDYLTAGTSANSTTATATWRPNIATAGRYDIYVWFPTISKGLNGAQFVLSDADGSLTNSLNQSSGSGGWLLLVAGRTYGQGTNGFVRLGNRGAGGKSVVADAVRWVYSSTQTATAPSIASQPQDESVSQGDPATFGVSAIGTTPLSYQWLFLGLPVLGATSDVLTIPSATTADAGGYSVVVTNVAGSVTSSVAVLTVFVAPGIIVQPLDQTVLAGQTANFSVTALGVPPLSYQWRWYGTNLVGTPSTASLTITNAQPADAGPYKVVIQNLLGSVTSIVATLTVLVPPDFSLQPLGRSVAVGTAVTFNVAALGTVPLSYQWRLNGSDIFGATTDAYTRLNVQSADAGSYTVLVTNIAGSILSDPAVLIVNNPPVLAPISDQTLHAGATLRLATSATDPDFPPQTLTFNLDPGAPPGATIGPADGLLVWNPTVAQPGTTNAVTVRVTDNGTPALSDTKSFRIGVVAPLTITSISVSNGSIAIVWNAIPGQTYRVQYKDDLGESGWSPLGPDVIASGSVATKTDSIGTGQRFYRVALP